MAGAGQRDLVSVRHTHARCWRQCAMLRDIKTCCLVPAGGSSGHVSHAAVPQPRPTQVPRGNPKKRSAPHVAGSEGKKRPSAPSSSADVIDLTDSPPVSPKGWPRAKLAGGSGGGGGGGHVISLCSSDEES
jgi:hypothetical protein